MFLLRVQNQTIWANECELENELAMYIYLFGKEERILSVANAIATGKSDADAMQCKTSFVGDGGGSGGIFKAKSKPRYELKCELQSEFQNSRN